MDIVRKVPRIALSSLLVLLLIAPAPMLAQEEATGEPTAAPIDMPTEVATEPPTAVPTEQPTEPPTEIPTEPPTAIPTEPTTEATQEVTATEAPVELTAEPTLLPELTVEATPELTAEATLETLLGAPEMLVARVEPVTEASLMVAKVFVVNSLADTADPNGDFICDVDLLTAGNQCTLRAAIQVANLNPGKDTINFNIPGTGPHTILVPGALLLPNITEAVIINGMSEPGYTWATPQIVIDGAGLGGSGLYLANTANGSVIKGLVINNGWTNAIQIFGANNLIQGNFLGLLANGTAADGNTYGVRLNGLNATNNTIGGTSAALRNVISGNTSIGVLLENGPNGNRIQGNYIGSYKTGAAAPANTQVGVGIYTSASNTVGGAVAGARNVISGNGFHGIYLLGAASSSNVVAGNYIGLNAGGNADLGNAGSGVVIEQGPNNTIGGTVAGARNVISGNNSYGIEILGVTATGNRITANYVGTDKTGTLDLGNNAHGIGVNGPNSTVIGGTTAALRNLVSGNGVVGIAIIVGNNSLVEGNYVGTNAAGTGTLPNSDHGIWIGNGSSSNVIGGTVTGAGNRIAYNLGHGIQIQGGVNNRLLSNLIYSNGELGIDLVGAADLPNGVLPNDLDDPDGGPNNGQNYPILYDMRGNRFTGRLNSTASDIFRLQFYASPTCDPAGYGEGQRYLGTAFVVTDGGGDTSFNLTIPNLTVTAGWRISATATQYYDAYNTSEFSECIIANLGVPTLISPANNAITNDTTPQFKWSAVPNATGYIFEYSFDPTFQWYSYDPAVPASPQPSFTPPPLTAGESYYWRVRTKGAGAQFTPTSATRRINIIG